MIHRPTNEVKATGVGACTTTETKYGYRWVSDPEAYGHDRQGLRVRQGKFRIPNPEREELENTILKMATKRAEVDAAQSLPGVGTSLARIFSGAGEKPKEPDPWTQFWAQAGALGLNADQVHQMLGVGSMKEWIAAGRTLKDAITVLSQKIAEQDQQELWPG